MSGSGTTINMPGGAETEIYKTAIQKDYALAEEAQKVLIVNSKFKPDY
jgi:hypothetical protein